MEGVIDSQVPGSALGECWHRDVGCVYASSSNDYMHGAMAEDLCREWKMLMGLEIEILVEW